MSGKESFPITDNITVRTLDTLALLIFSLSLEMDNIDMSLDTQLCKALKFAFWTLNFGLRFYIWMDIGDG